VASAQARCLMSAEGAKKMYNRASFPLSATTRKQPGGECIADDVRCGHIVLSCLLPLKSRQPTTTIAPHRVDRRVCSHQEADTGSTYQQWSSVLASPRKQTQRKGCVRCFFAFTSVLRCVHVRVTSDLRQRPFSRTPTRQTCVWLSTTFHSLPLSVAERVAASSDTHRSSEMVNSVS
jgi:hypothetical protein